MENFIKELFHQDNAAIHQMEFQLVKHLPHSKLQTVSKTERKLYGPKFSNNNNVMSAVILLEMVKNRKI